jgi:hypothetical protein
MAATDTVFMAQNQTARSGNGCIYALSPMKLDLGFGDQTLAYVRCDIQAGTGEAASQSQISNRKSYIRGVHKRLWIWHSILL